MAWFGDEPLSYEAVPAARWEPYTEYLVAGIIAWTDHEAEPGAREQMKRLSVDAAPIVVLNAVAEALWAAGSRDWMLDAPIIETDAQTAAILHGYGDRDACSLARMDRRLGDAQVRLWIKHGVAPPVAYEAASKGLELAAIFGMREAGAPLSPLEDIVADLQRTRWQRVRRWV